TVLSVAPTTLSFHKVPIGKVPVLPKQHQMVPTDMVPVLLVRHQVPNLFETLLVGLEFRAVSFKVSLSFALIPIIAILIIVFVAVVVVGVVVIVAVVVGGGVVVVGIYRSASTVPGQMGNPFAIIAPRWARTFMMVIILRT
nr:hypothetical protein [Tanacetum cinerariifolium]